MSNFKQVSSLLNFAHPTGFVIDIPIPDIGLGKKLETIGYSSEHFAMNIQDFTINRLQLGNIEVNKQAYKFILPNQTDATEKQFTINYKLSSGWQQYYFLCLWYQANLKVIKHIEDETIDSRFYNDPDYLLVPIRLWVLDENKDPSMLITYKDCWLFELGEMQLSYIENKPTLSHSFSCYYNDFTIELLNKELNNV
jgi:hypothetical protein